MLGQISELAAHMGGQLQGADMSFDGIGTDTRQNLSGQAYVALVGDRFDGNEYVEAAKNSGAVAAVVSKDSATDIPQIRVDDTLCALQRAASSWRQKFQIPVFGITGSNGKTTTKEMLASICRQAGPTLATHGNLNNHIGVPLTLARLREEHSYAVIEMGANHAGEIAALVEIARPTVGLITQAGDAHLEGFGSREGVAKAKGEMFAGLADDAVAVINADDCYVDLWLGLAEGKRVVTFGLEAESADVTASDIRLVTESAVVQWQFDLRIADSSASAVLPLLGRHNLMNALAAAAAAHAAGLSLREIVAGLAEMKPVPGRLYTRQGLKGMTVIDDTYNANPSSLSAGLDVLQALPQESWLALGDMAELGANSAEVHQEMGRLIRDSGVTRLFVSGELASLAAKTFGSGAEAFSDQAAMAEVISSQADQSVCLLVKGSRSAGMEAVVEALAKPLEQNGGAAC